MPLAGKQLLPRQIAELGHVYWRDDEELTKMVATALGESQGFVGANHLNGDDPAMATSEDCGLMQINIQGSAIGGPVERALMTSSKVEAEWRPIAEANVRSAAALYNEVGQVSGRRHWQPWVAYTTGWATFPEWWVWHQNAAGKPIGPWMKTGRYLQRALVGVANYHLAISKDKSPAEAVALAQKLARTFKVQGDLGIRAGIVAWLLVPAEPVMPPRDGIGPRPVPNQGR